MRIAQGPLPPKLEALLEDERDPREAEAWFQDLPAERREAWTEEWRAELRRRLELGLNERRQQRLDALEMGALFLVADLCTTLGSPLSLLVSLTAGALLGFLCSRFDLERLATVLLTLPAWIGLQGACLGGWSVMHMFVAFPLGCLLAYTAVRRVDRAFL